MIYNNWMIIFNTGLDSRARLVDHPFTYNIPCIDQWLGKYCILQRNRAKWGVGKLVWIVPKTNSSRVYGEW